MQAGAVRRKLHPPLPLNVPSNHAVIRVDSYTRPIVHLYFLENDKNVIAQLKMSAFHQIALVADAEIDLENFTPVTQTMIRSAPSPTTISCLRHRAHIF